jgi:hypothetical protein
MSVFSISYWVKKGYSEEEAKHQVDIRRPTNVAYYINKGHTEEEARRLVTERQKKGGEKRKNMSLEEKKKLTPRCLEFWIAKGLSLEEAQNSLSEFQTHFNKKICVEKYGEEEGLKVWKDRQDRWQETLNSKSSEEIQEINAKKNRWKNLSQEESATLKEKVGLAVKDTVSKRSREDSKEIFDRIVKTKISLGQYMPIELQPEFEKYKRKVWSETKRNNLSLLENYNRRGRTDYHLDHMYSIWQGFIDNTPAEITGHICNLKMIPYIENISKHTKSSITLEVLKQLILLHNNDN